MKKTLFFISLLLFTLTGYSQEKRLALVIGNSGYKHGGVLRNPVNDAMSMKKELYAVGFDVLEYFNLDQGGMKKAIDDFGLKLRNYEVGLFFYAGHGIQADGDNYLVPVDADVISEMHVEYDCVRADRVLAHMDNSRTDVNIVILDACRNNPFERSWSRSGSGSGLAFMNAPSGTLIAYATAPGSVASDGTGMNGLYTEAILENMRIPDISILEMFQNVRNTVNEKSNFQQTPWESTSLVGNFYFLRNPDAISPSENIAEAAPVKEQPANKSKVADPFDGITMTATEDIFNNARSGRFTDLRDQHDYKWVRIGEQVWMAENLNYYTESGSRCRGNSASNCEKYGRLYDLESAKRVCPDSWHLPTDEEWKILETKIGLSQSKIHMEDKRGEKEGYALKASEGWGRSTSARNMSGFTALPGGARIGNSSYSNGAYFWASPSENGKIFYRYLHPYNGGVYREAYTKTSLFSVRCVKN